MASTFQRVPQGRARSRFSKALPLPPEVAPLPISKDQRPALTSTSTSSHSLLPPTPKDSPPVPESKVSAMAIPRRPVGRAFNAPAEHSKTVSIASMSSVYSDSPGFSRSLSNCSNKTKDSLSAIDSESGLTPPLPPKHIQRQQLPHTPDSTIASPASGFQNSPPRPEIWKRRSVKSDRSIVVPELKLNKSNGSTASPPRQPPPAHELRSLPQLPRSLQGRKPVPARPAPPQPDLSGMGNKLSKLKDKQVWESSDSSEYVIPQTHPSVQRLPTPEYLKTDKQQPITPQVLSPASPETPPIDQPHPTIPLKSELRSTNTSTNTLTPESFLAITTNGPNLLSSHSRDTSETLTITSEPQIMRSPQPKKAYAAHILTPQPSPPPENDRILPLALPSPAARLALKFPKPTTPASPSTIFQGPELSVVHLECYQNHKFMRSSKNTVCPVACMICRKREMGPRWKCSWCCMSACGSCMRVLDSIPGKDLKVCLETIEKRAERSHGSQRTRHGTGSGSGSWR